MVYGTQPECSSCKTKESAIWEKRSDEILCLNCFKTKYPRVNETNNEKDNENENKNFADGDKKEACKDISMKALKDDDNDNNDNKESVQKVVDKKDLRRKTRKGKYGGKGNIPKGKGRRYIFKKSTTKAPASVSTAVTCDYVFHQGTYYQVGDIVSVIDIEGGTYYAQIRGLLQDQYCEKSAVITWLLPTKGSPKPEEAFDPSTYIIGPEEDVPRKLEYMRFVCHAPSEYFKDRTSPYATNCFKPQSCYVWSKMGAVIKPIDDDK